MTDLVALPIMYNLLCYGTSQQMIIYGLVYTAFFIVMALVGKIVYMRSSADESKINNSQVKDPEIAAN